MIVIDVYYRIKNKDAFSWFSEQKPTDISANLFVCFEVSKFFQEGAF